jgi:hypothetical protein
MSSYCDINTISNHPNFTNRLKSWENGPNGAGGCTLDSSNCLSNSEFSCYASYTLGTKRTNLDASLRSIYQPHTSVAATFDSNYSTTMLTGVVWAMLGTTVLYYAFTKM